MYKSDIDWAYVAGSFMMLFVIMLAPWLFLAGVKFDERYGERIESYVLKLDAYLLRKLKKVTERTARKTR